MKNSVLFLLTTFFILGLLIQPGCKTADDPADQYTLAVTVGTGVTGTPITGTHSYEENQIVPYSYTLQSGYVNLEVNLDGIPVTASGSITMNSNHTLNATAGEPAVEYTLTVTVGTGISGVPTPGTYTYEENQIVSYSYTLETGYENLEVNLDGIPIADSGVITMNSNHTLNATSDKIFDPNGDWAGLVVYLSIDYIAELNFSGGYYSGTVSGDVESLPPDVTGTYAITNGQIEFELDYGGGSIMSFTGTIDDDNNMSGDYTCTWGPSGTWYLIRQ
ncbi:MAG: hypothetical protein KAT17_07125 [Candidatus Aminicenantes bacterium]|nr:hypothetical protein [Candidatus Aminicenantes bacterium]